MSTVEGDTLLDVSQLRVAYLQGGGGGLAANDVDFRLRRGEALGIVGESGSGKSSVANAVAGLLWREEADVTAKRLSFDGNDLIGLGERLRTTLLGRRIGFVFQNPFAALNPILTVGHQLTDHIRSHLGLGRAAADDRAASLLAEVGISDTQRRMASYPHEFSGGMLQRVTIAMALACDPELLIADEPTTALDASVQADIVDLVRRLRRSRSLALIWITHDLALLRQVVERVAVMYAGRIVEVGSTEAIYSTPKHPYTRALVGSIRSMWEADEGPFTTIDGTPPRLDNLPTGCAFRPRCLLAHERCTQMPMPLAIDEPGHFVSCWAAHPGDRA